MEGVIHQLGLVDVKSASTPGIKEDSELSTAEILERRNGYKPPCLKVRPHGAIIAETWDSAASLPELSVRAPESPLFTGELLQLYQTLAARVNCYSLDRFSMLHPVKELMRMLSKPTDADMRRLKRAARYLLSRSRMVVEFPWVPLSTLLTIYTGADHAGCLRTRKSTSGGVILWGKALVKALSRTQLLIALSSGESEFAAVAKAAAEDIGVRSVLGDFDHQVTMEMHSDATAAIGICKRQWLGRVRHFATADLWLQQRVKTKELPLFKLLGKDNPAQESA